MAGFGSAHGFNLMEQTIPEAGAGVDRTAFRCEERVEGVLPVDDEGRVS